MTTRKTPSTSGLNFKISSDTTVSLRVLLTIVGLFLSVLIPAGSAWTYNLMQMNNIQHDLQTIQSIIKEDRINSERGREDLQQQVDKLETSLSSLHDEVRFGTVDRWTKEDDQRYMDRYSVENGLLSVPHYRSMNGG